MCTVSMELYNLDQWKASHVDDKVPDYDNLEAKSKPGGQNGMSENKDQTFYQMEPFLIANQLKYAS